MIHGRPWPKLELAGDPLLLILFVIINWVKLIYDLISVKYFTDFSKSFSGVLAGPEFLLVLFLSEVLIWVRRLWSCESWWVGF